MKTMYVYILTNRRDGVLYTGVTNNLWRRVGEHKARKSGSFTARYNATNLVYYEKIDGPIEAIRREKQIKGWLRSKKIALIESMNPDWIELDVNWMHEEFG